MKKKISVMLMALFLGGVSLTSSAQNVNADTLSRPDSTANKDVPQTASEKRKAILTPEYYTKFLGASFFTIPNIENEFDVRPVRILGATFFYDFGDCFVGMRSNDEGVVIQMNIRLFGDNALDFVQKAIDYGYKYVANGTNVNIRATSDKLLPDIYDSDVMRYRKTTDHGSVYLEVATSEQYAGQYEITIFRAK